MQKGRSGLRIRALSFLSEWQEIGYLRAPDL